MDGKTPKGFVRTAPDLPSVVIGSLMWFSLSAIYWLLIAIVTRNCIHILMLNPKLTIIDCGDDSSG